MKKTSSTVQMLLALVIFGTIALFRRWVPLPSSVVAMTRGLGGALILILIRVLRGGKLERSAIRKNGWLLVTSGALIGINWVLLFESYRYTSVSTATLCYYLAPTFVTLFAPLVLSEKPSFIGYFGAVAALGGMVLLSDATTGGVNDSLGILLGVIAAVTYAMVVFLNKKIHDVPSADRTLVQLFAAGSVLIPYVLITEWGTPMTMDLPAVGALAVMCLVHTALAYTLYLGSIAKVSAAKTAVLAYLDPLVAVLISVTLLGEPMTWKAVLGAILILGSALVSELLGVKKDSQ